MGWVGQPFWQTNTESYASFTGTSHHLFFLLHSFLFVREGLDLKININFSHSKQCYSIGFCSMEVVNSADSDIEMFLQSRKMLKTTHLIQKPELCLRMNNRTVCCLVKVDAQFGNLSIRWHINILNLKAMNIVLRNINGIIFVCIVLHRTSTYNYILTKNHLHLLIVALFFIEKAYFI